MEQKQLTPEELSNVKELALSLNNITSKFGQLKNALDKDYFELKDKEYTLSKELSEKYGEGTLNLETGTIS